MWITIVDTISQFHIIMPTMTWLPDGSAILECPPYSEWYDTFDRGSFCKAI